MGPSPFLVSMMTLRETRLRKVIVASSNESELRTRGGDYQSGFH